TQENAQKVALEDLKSVVRKDVRVRLPPSAPLETLFLNLRFCACARRLSASSLPHGSSSSRLNRRRSPMQARGSQNFSAGRFAHFNIPAVVGSLFRYSLPILGEFESHFFRMPQNSSP